MIAIAFLGAVVHATAQLKLARDSERNYTKSDFFINFIIAIFAGVVFGFASRLFFTNQDIVILCTAVGSFLGITGLNTISATVLQVLQTKIEKK